MSAPTQDQVLPHAAARGDAASPSTPAAERAACHALLPRVSRTFAISIRLLPARLRYPVTVAYLVCRIADTIEDAGAIAPERRAELLRRLAAELRTGAHEPGWLAAAFAGGTDAEGDLMQAADGVMRELRALAPHERASIARWAAEMCDGMAKHAVLGFGDAGMQRLATEAELREYCYYVAGTVGHLLTELFRAHRPETWGDPAELAALGEDFGIALQLTNIVKDAADDSQRGRAFVPHAFEPGGHGPESPTVAAILATADRTDELLRRALTYTLRIPAHEPRIRAFCLSALALAVQTVAACRTSLAQGQVRTKLSRRQVRATVLAVCCCAPSRTLTRWYVERLAARTPQPA